MTRRTFFVSAAAAALVLALTPALTVSAAQNYGPYPSSSGDSGTCGNNWADDAFDRHFTVTGSFGTFAVTEQFQDGSFKTPSTDPSLPDTNQSPGACNGHPDNGGKVDAGITGTFGGYFVIPLPATTIQMNSSSDCTAGAPLECTTANFINTHFTPCYPTTCPVTSFKFDYFAEDQCLIDHHWQNASSGNSGDIRSGPPCCQEGDGNGDFQGQQQGDFSFDGDGCRDGDSDSVDSNNRGDGKDFHSTNIQSKSFDSAAHTVTISGIGLAGGVPTSFVFVALETGLATPGWVSFTFSDGYSNAGTLLNGNVLLH